MRPLPHPAVVSAVLALAACTTAPAPAAPAPAPPALPAPVTSVLARLAITGTHSSIDVEAAGTGPEAIALCEALVARELRRTIADLTVTVVRPCLATALPARPGGGGIHLLSPEPITTAHLAVLMGERPISGTGLVTRVARMPNEAACRRQQDAAVAASTRNEAEAAAQARRFLVEQLQVSDTETQEICDQVQARPVCAPRDDVCVTSRAQGEQDCAHRRTLGTVLRDRLAQPLGPSAAPPPRCVIST